MGMLGLPGGDPVHKFSSTQRTRVDTLPLHPFHGRQDKYKSNLLERTPISFIRPSNGQALD